MVDCIVFVIVYIVGVIVVLKESKKSIDNEWTISDVFTSVLFVSSVLSIAVLSLFDFTDKVKNIDFVISNKDLSHVAVGMAIFMAGFFVVMLVVGMIKRETKLRRMFHGYNS